MKTRRRSLLWMGVLASCGGVLIVGLGAMAIGQATGVAPSAKGVALMAQLATARGGQTIRLAPGDYGTVIVPLRTWQPALKLIATDARFSGLRLDGVVGLDIEGGTVIGNGGRSYGIEIKNSKKLTIRGMTITGAHRGIVLGRSSDVVLADNLLTGLLSDGIDIALARRITVSGNRCREFSPTPTTFDAQGKRLAVGDHPDCIQAWSRPAEPPVADLIIENNTMEGRMQGIFLGNHIRNGIDDGGFDRIVVRNNTIRVTHPNGIALLDARDSVVTANRVSTYPGAVNPRRLDRPVRSSIRVTGTANRVCGNTIADFPNAEPTRPCR